MTVRKSDDPGFPITAGVTSHDACLRAMEGVHVCIVLIGTRFGGLAGGSKSITWMEYEAARELGAYPIVLIHDQMNDLAVSISKARLLLAKKHPHATEVDLDSRLRKKKEFSDRKPMIDNLPGQQRFVDAVRKGHVDNWVHNEWTGTTRDALMWIDARLATLLASTVDKFAELNARTSSLLRLNDALMVLLRDVLDGRRSRLDAVQSLLVMTESFRVQLFGFATNDRYNMSIFMRGDRDIYQSIARRSHAAIVRHDRPWRIGLGQVGTAATMSEPLITRDLSTSSMRTTDPVHREADHEYYKSVVSVPLLANNGKADLVFMLSTDREGHFHAARQPEVLTAVAVGHILGTLWLVGGHIDGH